MWAPSCKSTSSPRLVLTNTPIWLVIVPEGAYRAASLPSNSATYSSRWLTVGSSPKTSSPTGASNIASRIPSVGRVTVSLRRSITRLLLVVFHRTKYPPRGGEVDLRYLRKPLLSQLLDHPSGGPYHVCGTPRQLEADPLRESLHLLQIPRPRQDRSRRHRRVVLGPRPHLEPHPARHVRLQVGTRLLPEGVHDDHLYLIFKFTNYLRVKFPEQPVDVTARGCSTDLIFSGSERDDAGVLRAQDPAYSSGHLPHLSETEDLRVTNPDLPQFAIFVRPEDPRPSDHQGAEILSFPGLVGSDPGRRIGFGSHGSPALAGAGVRPGEPPISE